MENFCLELREHAAKVINYEKIEMIPLIKKENLVLQEDAIHAKKV